jgi:hypothetical protein
MIRSCGESELTAAEPLTFCFQMPTVPYLGVPAVSSVSWSVPFSARRRRHCERRLGSGDLDATSEQFAYAERLGMLWFILWLIAVALWIFVIVDVLRRDDLTTMVKITWIVIAFVLPYLGVVAYFVARWQTQRAASAR